MYLGLILTVCCATVMAVPATPLKNETLRELIRSSPEVMEALKNATRAYKISKAAAYAGIPGPEPPADLNLGSSLNNILIGIIRGIIDKLIPSTPAAPTPTPNPSIPAFPNYGNGNFQPISGPSFFNPFGFLGGSNMFFPGFMFDIFENFW